MRCAIPVVGSQLEEEVVKDILEDEDRKPSLLEDIVMLILLGSIAIALILAFTTQLHVHDSDSLMTESQINVVACQLAKISAATKGEEIIC